MGYTRLIQPQREAEEVGAGSPLISVFGSHMPLIPALGRWSEKGIWLGRDRNIRQEETGT